MVRLNKHGRLVDQQREVAMTTSVPAIAPEVLEKVVWLATLFETLRVGSAMDTCKREESASDDHTGNGFMIFFLVLTLLLTLLSNQILVEDNYKMVDFSKMLQQVCVKRKLLVERRSKSLKLKQKLNLVYILTSF